MLSPPLKWHGGKHYLAKKIIDLMPRHIHYVEPYFGGGAVLLAMNPDGKSEVVNDLNQDLSNFWNVLADKNQFKVFERMAQATPFSEYEWNKPRPDDNIARAVWFFVRCRQSMAGRMDCFTPLSRNRTRRGMNEQVSSWLTAIDGLPDIHSRLKRVVILNRDALEVLKSQDCDKTLFYLDPPYLHETRSTTGEYKHEMTEEQHAQLLEVLTKIKGKFLLSGYRSNLYDDVARSARWVRHEFELPNNAASGAKKERKIECVWANQ